MTCHSKDCDGADVATAFWPGYASGVRFCIPCTLRALSVADALEFKLAVVVDPHFAIPLPPSPAELRCAVCGDYGCEHRAPTVRP